MSCLFVRFPAQVMPAGIIVMPILFSEPDSHGMDMEFIQECLRVAPPLSAADGEANQPYIRQVSIELVLEGGAPIGLCEHDELDVLAHGRLVASPSRPRRHRLAQ